MKRTRQILALLVAMIVALGISKVAYAAETGSITIENAQAEVTVDGEVKQNEYIAYKIFDANPLGDGSDATSPDVAWGGTVGYTVSDAAYQAYWATKSQALFSFTQAASGEWIVRLNDGVDARDVSEFFSTNVEEMKANTTAFPSYAFSATGAGTTANVPYGYYFISSTNGSVVSVDTTNLNVTIVDKNVYDNTFSGTKEAISVQGGTAEAATPVADVDANLSVAIGDTVGYQLAFETSNYQVAGEGDSKYSQKVSYVYVTDTLGDGMNYTLNANENAPQLTVKIDGAELTGTVLAKADYDALGTTVQPAEGAKQYYVVYNTEAQADGTTKESFQILIPWLYADGNTVFADNAQLTIDYSALVTALVDEAEGQAASVNSKNTAELTYDVTDPDQTPPDPEYGSDKGVENLTEELFIYAVAFKKVDGNDLHKLEGARFTLADAQGNAIGAVLDTTDGSKTQGYYVYSSANTAETEGYTTEFVSDSEGRIVIYGLQAGTYTATEQAAPAGYNLLKDTITLEAITAGSTTTTTTITTEHSFVRDDANGTYKQNDDGTFEPIAEGETVEAKWMPTSSTTDTTTAKATVDNLDVNTVSIVVENFQGTVLPSTGGIGTTIFYVVGGAMIITAAVLLITKRRMSKLDK